MSLLAGTRIGVYEVLALLGAGGMGEVYRARDTKLNRDVALKVLPENFARDPERMARFEREAQVLASLNHPNIAAIYGLEESGATRALVMELVEGPTLAEIVGADGIRPGAGIVGADGVRPGEGARSAPLQEMLAMAKQIADALEAAHEKNIIHRDLKPANIKVKSDGVVKVLDFGLAKALDVGADSEGARSAPLQDSPTLSLTAQAGFSPQPTRAGMILGTAAYMSPEQAKGKPVDRRTDIWAFGCVLYEMLAGRKVFEGETLSDVLAGVIVKEPEWSALPADTPLAIEKLIRRCLQKDAKQRLQAIGEARITIEEAMAGVGAIHELPLRSDTGADPGSGQPHGLPLQAAGQRPALQRALPWAVAGIVTIAAVATIYFALKPREQVRRMQFAIPLPSEAVNIALSADGRMLAYVAHDETSGANMLYFERIGAASPTRLAGTEGASYPFWSSDDKDIGYFANGELQKVSLSGGVLQVLAAAVRGRGGSWGSKGVIIYAPDAGGPLWQVGADGSGAKPLTKKCFLPGESSHRWPEFLPDGKHFLFLSSVFGAKGKEGEDGIYLSSFSAPQTKRFVIPEDSNFALANGHLYFEDARNNLVVVPFSLRSDTVAGEPKIVAQHVSFNPSVFYANLSAGGEDTVVYSSGAAGFTSIFTWFDRSGKELGYVGQPGVEANPSLSPDGNRALLDIDNRDQSASVDVWIENLKAGTASRFTFDPAEDAAAIWSRDGKTIAYRTNDLAGAGSLMVKNATGLEAARRVYHTNAPDDILPNSWSPDDKSILCTYEPVAGGSELEMVNVASGKMTPFMASKASETNGMISPDGKWLAYASNETGEWEIYVTTFPGAQGKWQVSRGGGTEPRWEGDGKEIYYIDAKGMLDAVPVSAQGTFSAGTPIPLFALHGRAPISNTDIFTYDVSKRGKRFLVNRYVAPKHVKPLTVILNADTK